MFFKIYKKNNNKEYEIRPGFSITSNYNETLDSANIVISHIKEAIDIEPFDECEIISDYEIEGFLLSEEDNKYHLYMAVDSYQKNQLSVEKNPYYEYQITLFSQTKFLEGIILPSLKITRGKKPRKIYGDWGYLDTYLQEYGDMERARIVHPTTGREIRKFIPRWQYSNRVIERFSKIDCPEMQWNNPTLRQVITDLMMVDDCIPVLRNGEIDYIDISEEKNEASKIGVNYIRESQSSDDYVSEIRMDIKNAIQGVGIFHERTYVDVCEKISFRNSDSGILTDQNIRLETAYPIYDLTTLKMQKWIKAVTKPNSQPIYYYDEANLVSEGVCVESGVYRTKPIWYKELPTTIEPIFSEFSKYQNFNVYYTRGGNTIDGWNVLTNMAFFGKNQIRAVDMIQAGIMNKSDSIQTIDESGHIVQIFLDKLNREYNIGGLDANFFEIRYKTTADALFQASKSKNATNNRVIVDNQTNSYVDAKTQGVLEYMKANRLGNKMKLINARYEKTDYDKIANLGDTFGDNIIFQKEISVFDDYIMANYYATENYVLRDYFTGVKAKQRSWKLIEGKDALERHDLIKKYLELSFKEAKEVAFYKSNIFSSKLEQLGLSPLNALGSKYNYSVVRFNSFESSFPSDTSPYYYYCSEFVSRIVGNSIVLNVKMNDNIYFGKFINGETTGGFAQNPLAYADSNGENVGGTILFFENFKNMPTDLGYWSNVYDYSYSKPTDIINNMKTTSNALPQVKESQVIEDDFTLKTNFKYHKDNSEITNISVQLEFCTDTDEIVIGKKFIELQSIISGRHDNDSYKLYGSNTKPSTKTAEFLPTDKTLVDRNKWTITPEEKSVLIKASIVKDYAYITDANDNVIIAFANLDKGLTITSRIYLNSLDKRNKEFAIGGGNIYVNN